MNANNLPPTKNIDDYVKRYRTSYFMYDENIVANEAKCAIRVNECSHLFPNRDTDFPNHVHQEFEMIIPHGLYHCMVNGVELEVKQGEILLIQPGDSHLDHLRQDEPYYGIVFQCHSTSLNRSITRIFHSRIAPREQIIAIRENEYIIPLLDIIIEESQSFEGGHFNIVNNLTQAIFWKIIRNCEHELLDADVFSNDKKEACLHKILAVFRKNIGRMPDIPLFCRQASMSRSSLERACHDFFKMPAGRAFTSFKVNYAKQILKGASNMTIKSLSLQLGFANQYHFSNVFKKMTGISPSEYQRQK